MLLQEHKYYHIYNQGNNREILFREPRNYYYFLQLWKRHIYPFADTFAYHLLPNHFHVAIRIRNGAEVSSKQISRCFANMFGAYAKAINKGYDRSGSLFRKNFRRKEISSESRFLRLILYIHTNANHHGIPVDLMDCKFSSYASLLSQEPTLLCRKQVLEWFSGVEAFQALHQEFIVQEDDLSSLFENPQDDVHLLNVE